ncbi:hypothetical protein EON63_00585 [archaeon]|nr:MAG: hypothetical protein EON63_00585 [archaeon]
MSDSDIVVLWVSRIVPEKRPDIFLDVVKRLQDEGLPVKPLVVGSGTYEKYLSKLQHVVCCGWLSGMCLSCMSHIHIILVYTLTHSLPILVGIKCNIRNHKHLHYQAPLWVKRMPPRTSCSSPVT